MDRWEIVDDVIDILKIGRRAGPGPLSQGTLQPLPRRA